MTNTTPFQTSSSTKRRMHVSTTSVAARMLTILVASCLLAATTTNAFVSPAGLVKAPSSSSTILFFKSTRTTAGDRRSFSWRKRLLTIKKKATSPLESTAGRDDDGGRSVRSKLLVSSSALRGLSPTSKRARILKWAAAAPLVAPLNAKKTNDNDNDDNDAVHEKDILGQAAKRYKELVEAWNQAWEAAWLTLPESLRQTCQVVWEFLGNLRWAALSFVAGSIFATTALLVPLYNQVETLSKPVTLFETILSDLEAGYVDPVDTNKLFETGVSAMLRSLDPYTEYEGPQEAVELNESIDGKYGGVGLVIAGNTKPMKSRSTTLQQQPPPAPTQEESPSSTNTEQDVLGKPVSSSTTSNEAPKTLLAIDTEEEDDEDMDEDDLLARKMAQRRQAKAEQQGIRVVNAFENYAFDYGMRVGDKLVAVDEFPITSETTVEGVRNRLRGEPGTMVSISFEREGLSGVQTVTMPRSVVRVRDVKLATLVGNPKDGIGYIQLSGFASETGREVRNAIHYLERASEDASNGAQSLQGLVLDLRGNPGGLLTSAVDVASLLVPKGSDIVSAKGRGFPGVLYRSRVDPILSPNTKLVVLVNRGTASAAEIVSGAIQDLDVGVVLGGDRTFGKGLVQNVEELPFQSALKFTVAKYYTPSGRCIQGINYKEGGGLKEEDGKYLANKIAKKDRAVFYTKNGRIVRDGGGVEADVKVEAPKASALEITLLRSGVLGDFAADWSKKNELTNNFKVDEDTYRSFQAFVMNKQKSGDLELEALYSKPLSDLKKALKASGYKGSEREVDALQASIVRDIQRDFEKFRKDIKEDISQSILARYLPESMLIERGVKDDVQVAAAIKLLANENRFDKLLARETATKNGGAAGDGSMQLASSITTSVEENIVRGKVKF